MGISDLIASFLQESLEETDGGVLEVQRNDLAQRFNCVPSQINYVMSTRFSPERGYIVGEPPGRQWLHPDHPGPGGPPDAADAGHQHPGQPGGPGLRSGHPEQSGPGRRPGGNAGRSILAAVGDKAPGRGPAGEPDTVRADIMKQVLILQV